MEKNQTPEENNTKVAAEENQHPAFGMNASDNVTEENESKSVETIDEVEVSQQEVPMFTPTAEVTSDTAVEMANSTVASDPVFEAGRVEKQEEVQPATPMFTPAAEVTSDTAVEMANSTVASNPEFEAGHVEKQAEVQPQTPMFTSAAVSEVPANSFENQAQGKPQPVVAGPYGVQPKKGIGKKLFWILGSIGLVVVLLFGAYGFSVSSKMQKISELKGNHEKLLSEHAEIQKTLDDNTTLVLMNDYSTCYQDASGVNGGRAFKISKFSVLMLVTSKGADNFKSELDKCALDESKLNMDEAQTLAADMKKELEDAYRTNEAYVAEAKNIVSEWDKFYSAFKASGGGELASDTYDNLRNLAANAMGVSPSTIGNELKVETALNKTYERLEAIEAKQVKVSGDKINQFISGKANGKSVSDVETELETKKEEQKTLEDEIDELKRYIDVKQSEVWTPFK